MKQKMHHFVFVEGYMQVWLFYSCLEELRVSKCALSVPHSKSLFLSSVKSEIADAQCYVLQKPTHRFDCFLPGGLGGVTDERKFDDVKRWIVVRMCQLHYPGDIKMNKISNTSPRKSLTPFLHSTYVDGNPGLSLTLLRLIIEIQTAAIQIYRQQQQYIYMNNSSNTDI